jgi:hypothetical protein
MNAGRHGICSNDSTSPGPRSNAESQGVRFGREARRSVPACLGVEHYAPPDLGSPAVQWPGVEE